VLLLSCAFSAVFTQKSDVDWIGDLERDVLRDYSHNISPYSHAKNSTSGRGVMRISLIYARLTTVDEQALEHSNILGLAMSWLDPRLKWNVSDYGGIDHLYVKLSKVWVPEAQFCE
ncbi:hypothetical protein PMAYCL1PPCAC_04786, partial [Pristionchus mayeri]